MNTWIEPFVAGLLLGLANAAHCAGMCGAFAVRAAARPGRATGFSAYALGKSFSYIVLGAVAGALGAKLLRNAGVVQAWVAVVAGSILAIAGVAKIFPSTSVRLMPERFARAMAAPFAGLLNGELPGGRFTLGAVNGLLPCGVVYLAALQGAAQGGAARSAVLMAGFGLGTLPILIGVGSLGGALQSRLGPRNLRIAGGVLLLATGAVLIFRAVLTIAAGKPSCCH